MSSAPAAPVTSSRRSNASSVEGEGEGEGGDEGEGVGGREHKLRVGSARQDPRRHGTSHNSAALPTARLPPVP